MRPVLQLISWLSCAGTAVPAVLFFLDAISLEQVKGWMLAPTLVWFLATPLWMGREHDAQRLS